MNVINYFNPRYEDFRQIRNDYHDLDNSQKRMLNQFRNFRFFQSRNFRFSLKLIISQILFDHLLNYSC
jgi:hypothetical protein